MPKLLGLESVATPEDAALVVEALERSTGGLFASRDTYCGRVDCTVDLHDPEGALRAAAVGWLPHERARYVEAVYQGGETVWLHNKTRGVRVYDKFQECGMEWARDVTRVEYQVRGDWLLKLGLRAPLSPVFGANVERAVLPVAEALALRCS